MYSAQLAFKKLVPGALLELMYIQKNDQDGSAGNATLAGTGYGVPNDANGSPNKNPGVVFYDIGARIDGKLPNLDAVDYTLESHGQFGDYGGQAHKDWALAARTG